MEIITRFDPVKAQKAHGDTILAWPVLPEGTAMLSWMGPAILSALEM